MRVNRLVKAKATPKTAIRVIQSVHPTLLGQ